MYSMPTLSAPNPVGVASELELPPPSKVQELGPVVGARPIKTTFGHKYFLKLYNVFVQEEP